MIGAFFYFRTGSNTGGRDPLSPQNTTNPAQGLLGTLISLLVAEKSGFQPAAESSGLATLQEFADRMTRDAMESMQQAIQTPVSATDPGTVISARAVIEAQPKAPSGEKAK